MKVTVIAIVHGIVACGNDGSSQRDAGVPLAMVPAAYASTYCERIFACCTPDEATERFPAAQPPVVDRTSCEDHVARVFGNEFVADTRAAESVGHARYDGPAMALCLEHLRDDECEHLARVFALMTLPEECPPVREPLSGPGDACDHDFQCTTSYCLGGSETTDGVCATLPVLGEPCPESRCVAGSYCERSNDPSGVCTPLAMDGEPCASPVGCAGFSCLGALPGTPGRCGAPQTCNGLR